MKENKKIDSFFKRRIPQHEQLPPEDVWENISARLTSPGRRRIIPLWFKLAGVAAVLILLITLFWDYSKPAIDSPEITNKPFNEAQEQLESIVEENTNDAASDLEDKSGKTSNTSVTNAHSQGRLNRNKAESLIAAVNKGNDRSKIKPLEISLRVEQRVQNRSQLSAGQLENNYLTGLMGSLIELKEVEDDKSEDIANLSMDNLSFKDRFSVAPTVAAVYSGKIGKGNALDNNFSQNSNPGNINMAYGVSIAYQLSDKTKIRSGINNITMSSTTLQVDNVSAINSTAFEGNPASSIFIPNGTGDLNQTVGFLEVPLELELALVEHAFGINLIVGASTYFLQRNEVRLNSAVINTDLGPANNINETSFSANLGLGFTYRFSPGFQFNLDPIIKYQINTYENVSGFKPYFLGVYTGFRFKL